MKDLSLHMLDIAQNSIRANATHIQIYIQESKKNDLYQFKILDNGDGMSPEMVKKVCDPFFTTRTTRKVGLGLPLLKQNAEQAGGDVEIVSELGEGTTTKAWYEFFNIDRPSAGNIANTMAVDNNCKFRDTNCILS
jgi:signal transduction histidine kinase